MSAFKSFKIYIRGIRELHHQLYETAKLLTFRSWKYGIIFIYEYTLAGLINQEMAFQYDYDFVV